MTPTSAHAVSYTHLDVYKRQAEQQLLAEALRRGEVHEFARIVPTLTDLYQEITAA